MAKKKTVEEVPADNHAVISGVTTTEMQENMRKEKFTDSCVNALGDLITRLLEVADEAVAKNELKPEIEQIILQRKSAGSPFFSVELVMSESTTPETVTTIADRVDQRINAVRVQNGRKQKFRAVDITSDADLSHID